VTNSNGRSEKQIIAEGIERFFRQNYELRYNILKQTEAFRPLFRVTAARENAAALEKNVTASREKKQAAGENATVDRDGWQQLTDRELRRIAFEQMKEVGVAWSVDVELYVRSAIIRQYNPVTDFLADCGEWDGQTDYIGQLAARVPTSYADWPQLFRCWLLAMVAQWLQLSRDYGNALVPMLIGAQGTHKSTFCRQLLPPCLREYYIDDIKLDNAEQVERMLGRMLLVNIDEYNAKTEREQAKIKRVLTERDVQTRRMRSDQYQLLPRMASFIATTNDRQPLTDPTGSRRYICCDIDGIIDTDTPIDHRQLYAQAVAELRSGKTWYLSKQEEQKLEQHNQNFRVEMSPEQVLLAWYTQAERRQENFIRTVDILKELSKHVGKADLPTVQSLTRTLRACGFAYGAVGGQRGWYAKLR
jgi:predicted P-loop ATPase